MFIIKIKETATHRTRSHIQQASTNCSYHGAYLTLHKTNRGEKWNSVTNCRITEQTYPSQTTTGQTKTSTQATTSTTLPTTKGCFRCGAKGHQAKVCHRSRNQKCYSCGKLGHFTNMCRTWKRHPPNWKKQQANKSNDFRTRNQQHQHVRTAAIEHESSDDKVYVFQIGNKSNTHPVLINDTEINVIIDSGSTTNILDENSFDSIMSQPKLEISSTKIYPYQSDSPLQPQGAAITANQTSLSTKFYIVKGNYGSLLGTQTATALDLLGVGPPKLLLPSVYNQITYHRLHRKSLINSRQFLKEEDVWKILNYNYTLSQPLFQSCSQ